MGVETVVELLLKNGAQPELEDEHRRTPLARAIERRNVSIVQLLLAQGVKTDYNYNIVSESNHMSIDLYLIDD